MFTGIIEEIGSVKEFSKRNENAYITIECTKILGDIKIGDSIAIDGICQTVVAFNQNSFSAEISQETLSVTTFSKLKIGNQVNLERALTLSTRLGGHIVSGHIDNIAKIKDIKKQSEFYNIKIEVDKNLTKYIVQKGSIAINGISLTIAELSSNELFFAVIPHTFENTTLKQLKIGDFVNIEVDILAKYVEKNLSTGNNIKMKSVVSENFLKENGFF